MILTGLITSRENDTIKYACKIGQNRAFRQSEKCFLAEGLKLCLDLAKTLTPYKVFYTQDALLAAPEVELLLGEHYVVNASVAQKLSDTRAPQGLFVLFEMPQTGLDVIVPKGRYLALQNVQDPANVGAMLRSAAAFGFDGALLLDASADAFSGKALRASMGAAAHIAIVNGAQTNEAIAALRAANIPIYAAALQNSVPLASVFPAAELGVALLIGNEGQGLTQDVMAQADAAVRIPIASEVESLNAAVAGSVLMWHFRGSV